MAGGPDEGPTGLAVVDKPAGWTSHDVVARARHRLGTRRVGHAGTLDPGATGVLLLGVGRATRLLRFLTALPKSYTGEIVLGTETTTLDDDGDVVAVHDMTDVTVTAVAAAARRFVGGITQVPPMVSAVQVGGRRLHALSREGVEVDRPARRVEVSRFDVQAGSEPGIVRVEVDCSSGTYVRALAADLGRALGGGAHLRRLRRVGVGRFTVADARPLDALELLPPSAAVAHLDRVEVDDAVARLVGHGTPLRRAGEAVAFPGDGPWAVVSGVGGRLLAVYPAHGDRARPAVVLATVPPVEGAAG